MFVSLVIPTRDEESNVTPLLQEIWNALITTDAKYEVVIVDDSDDATAQIASEMGAKVVKGQRKGLAQAVIDGIHSSDGDVIIVMDADLQHPPSMLPQVIKQLKTHDLVVVSKHTENSHSELSWWRKTQSDLGCFAAKMLVPISDPMTGFFGIRRECLDGVELEGIGFKIGLEIFCKANWTSHYEIPMTFTKRLAGQSKGTLQSLQKHLWHLYKSSLTHRVTLPKGCDEWNAFYEGNGWHRKWKRSIALKIQEVTTQTQPKILLDVGCGSSPNINYAYGVEKFGIDVNRDALGFMKKHSDATFMHGDIRGIPFRDGYFDCVVACEVIEHLPLKDAKVAVSEVARVLKEGGRVIIATPNYGSVLWQTIECAQKLFQPGRWVDDHKTKWNRKSLAWLCGQVGLREETYDSVVADTDMVVTYRKERHAV